MSLLWLRTDGSIVNRGRSSVSKDGIRLCDGTSNKKQMFGLWPIPGTEPNPWNFLSDTSNEGERNPLLPVTSPLQPHLS